MSDGDWTASHVKEFEDTKLADLKELFQSEIRRIEAVLTGQERAVLLLREATETAQGKFETNVAARFVQVNEFRGSLDDLGKQMATRRELETAVTGLSDRLVAAVASLTDQVEKARQERQHQIDDLRTGQAELRSRVDVGAPQIPELQKFVDAHTGRTQGVQMSIGLILGIVGGIAAIITIVIVLANVLTSK